MSVFKRERSAFYYMEVPDGTGRTVRRSTKRTTKRAALEVEAQYLKDLRDAQTFGVSKVCTLGEAADSYLANRSLNSAASLTDIRRNLDKLLGRNGWEKKAFHLKDTMCLHEITGAVLEQFQMFRRAEGLANKSINIEMQTFRALYRRAIKMNFRGDPNLAFPMLKTQPKKRFLSAEEEERLLKELDPKRDIENTPRYGERNKVLQDKLQDQYDMTVMLLDTGQRYMEVASMPWDHVDTVHWRGAYVERSKDGEAGMIGMTNRLREILQRRHSERRNRYIFPSFTDPDGHRSYSTKGLSYAIKRVGLNDDLDIVAKRGKITAHSLRDTFATKLISRDVNLKVVSTMLGHRSTKTTEKYVHMHLTQASAIAIDALNDTPRPAPKQLAELLED